MQLEFINGFEPGDGELFLYFDAEGEKVLLAALKEAKQSGHDHLFSQDWGGAELSVSNGSKQSYRKVTITFVEDKSTVAE